MAMSPEKMCSVVWDWINSKMIETGWESRNAEYEKWWEIYRGRHWAQESAELNKSIQYKIVNNETKKVVDDLCAYLLGMRPRHYHINVDPSIIQSRAINMFLLRATNYEYKKMLADSVLYSAIYGSSIMPIGIDVEAEPWGYRGLAGETKLPMPTYKAEAPWQWIIDPTGAEDMNEARWAIRFGIMSKPKAERLAGREIKSDDSYNSSPVYNKFLSRTTPQYSIRNSSRYHERPNSYLAAEVWFNEVPIGQDDKPLIDSVPRWRYIRVCGDAFLSKDHWEQYDGDAPLGQKVGIPATIYNMIRMPGFMHGQSLVASCWSMQQDINIRRATLRQIEQNNRGFTHISGAGAKNTAEFLRQMRITGALIDPTNAMKVEHVRGELASQYMYMGVENSKNDLREIAGLPQVMSGESQQGVYTGKHAELLQTAAQNLLSWRAGELGRALSELGNKEWEALKYWWAERKILLDTGTEATIIDKRIMGFPGWTAEALPEDTYMKMIQQEKAEVAQLFQMGVVPPDQFLKRIDSLTDEEKEQALQYLQMQMQAAQAEQSEAPGKGSKS